MDRIHSAPASVSMAPAIPSRSANDAADRMDRRSISTIPATLSEQWEESVSDYTLYSKSSDPQFSSLESAEHVPSFAVNEIQEYSPAEFCNALSDFPPSTSLSSPSNLELSRLSVPQLTSQWNGSFDSPTSQSPGTPTSTGLATPSTMMSSSMSRHSSINTQFMGEISMLRVNSTSTSVSDVSVPSEDCFPTLSSDVGSKNISLSSDKSPFFSQAFTGPPSETLFPVLSVSSSASALPSFQTQSDLAEDMQRSTSRVSNSSSSTASSNNSRHVRRDREIMAQSSRPIAPKASQDKSESRAKSTDAQMVRVRSQDGSSKDVGLITKAPYVRPVHAKVRCPHCNEHPDGFRGEHELRRHYERAHAAVKKVWICIDASSDKKFLANCKNCRNKKQYGAYYNAAAHLRRFHFNPRKRGRKGKHEEKRGGIGGGDHPPMDELKANWIQEMDIENVQKAISDSDEVARGADQSMSESFDPNASAFDSQYSHFAVSTSVNPNQGINAFTAPSYDAANPLYFPGFPPNASFENFEFDAQPVDFQVC
jgi:hypothetical protein